MTAWPRVVVTGLGAVTPLGCDVASTWNGLVAGRSGVGPITRFDASGLPTRFAAEVDAAMTAAATRDRGLVAHFAESAAREAAADAGLEQLTDRSRIGVVTAAGAAGFTHAELAGPAAAASGPAGFDPARFVAAGQSHLGPGVAWRRSPGNIAVGVARCVAARGPILAVDTACAAGSQALGDALRWLRCGHADIVVAGAADSQITPLGVLSFCLLRVLSTRNDEPTRASRPFDRGRDGFVMGEGAGMLVLETLESALRRGARIRAELVGFGASCDAYRVTDPHPDGRGAVLAMTRALADAQLVPADVAVVNAHGTSTLANDRIEVRALHQVFGDHAASLAVPSTKSMTGHLTVAAGAVEAIALVRGIEAGIVAPTINLEDPDPACDLDHVPGRARELHHRVALSNSFGFGGQCSSVVFAAFAR